MSCATAGYYGSRGSGVRVFVYLCICVFVFSCICVRVLLQGITAREEVVFGAASNPPQQLVYSGRFYRQYDDDGDDNGDDDGDDNGSHGGDGTNQIADSMMATLPV